MNTYKRLWLTIITVMFFSAGAQSESANDSVKPSEERTLKQQVESMDAKLFSGFNQCDIATMRTLMHPELEFYHDKVGVSGREETLASSQNHCDAELGLTRTLLPETSRVYPVKNFGAMHKAKHRFCHLVNGKNDCGVFEFVHVWKKVDQDWLLYRVMSYDH